MAYKITACGGTDPGQVRESNEDAWGQIEELHFYALADGMGGHQAGEVASREAIESLSKYVRKMKKHMTLTEARQAYKHAIEQVNGIIFRLGHSDEHLKGMGTTLCCIQFVHGGVVYAHVGDSRIYRLRNKNLEIMTSDHSLLRELMDLGQIKNGKTSDLLYKNILTRAVGTEPVVEPSIYTCDVAVGDTYLMCSDGLSDLINNDELQAILIGVPDPKTCVETLIHTANQKGGHDNITAVIMHVLKIP